MQTITIDGNTGRLLAEAGRLTPAGYKARDRGWDGKMPDKEVRPGGRVLVKAAPEPARRDVVMARPSLPEGFALVKVVPDSAVPADVLAVAAQALRHVVKELGLDPLTKVAFYRSTSEGDSATGDTLLIPRGETGWFTEGQNKRLFVSLEDVLRKDEANLVAVVAHEGRHAMQCREWKSGFALNAEPDARRYGYSVAQSWRWCASVHIEF